jgi:hypothetical protein
MLDGVDEAYQLAADMGGAGYVFTDESLKDLFSVILTASVRRCPP